jgi:hypothetical protein
MSKAAMLAAPPGNAVEAVGVFQHGGVAARLDVGQDAATALDGVIGAASKASSVSAAF